ncbi:sigma-70 family RNA polymerase sigma factor, partial [Sinomicrobium pectinilyticum]
AKDCIQEFFIKLWQIKERLGDVYALGPYLFKSFRRYILNEASKQRRVTSVSSDSVFDKDATPSTEYSLIEKEKFNSQQKALKAALEKLSEREREIIYLKFYGHLEYDEIAEVLNIQKKSVYNFTTRALKHLRYNLRDLYLLITFLFLA